MLLGETEVCATIALMSACFAAAVNVDNPFSVMVSETVIPFRVTAGGIVKFAVRFAIIVLVMDANEAALKFAAGIASA